ncbi:MAG: hypothetical protein DRN91_06300 [Candidatus Alkanophagales archaeon]|nr:MAG: hypothetical protein DRN91_06300 [Candidatus Alkanophagales archaeon]
MLLKVYNISKEIFIYWQQNGENVMVKIERIKTYVERLDEHIEGGIPKGSVSLICGMPGCMKSSLAYSILYHNAINEGRRGLYITLEQPIPDLKLHMAKLNMSAESENLTIVDYNTIEEEAKSDMRFETNWMKRVKNYVEDVKRKDASLELVVIDSLNALYSLTMVTNPRKEIYYLFKGLKDTEVTSFLVSEMELAEKRFSRYGVEEFIADAIIHLDLTRKEGPIPELERYLCVVKMRSTHHDLQYFPFMYEGDRFVIYTKKELEL